MQDRKEARRAYMKAYYEKNKETLLEKQRARNAANYQANKERYQAKSKAWRLANRERVRELQSRRNAVKAPELKAYRQGYYQRNKARYAEQSRLSKLRRHGLTPAAYHTMLKRQGGGCAICTSPTPQQRKRQWLYVDHCHRTGRVRGLLCHPCNAAIGQFRDDPALLAKAIAYLTR